MYLGWEWALIAWLYVFGAAAFGCAFRGRGPAHMADFFVVAMWPVLWPIFTVVKSIYEIFDK